jgi:hypothetical protein
MLVISSCIKVETHRSSGGWLGRGIQDRVERRRSDGSVVRGASADVTKLITGHVEDGGNERQTLELNTRADHLGWGVCECEDRESAMGAWALAKRRHTGRIRC